MGCGFIRSFGFRPIDRNISIEGVKKAQERIAEIDSGAVQTITGDVAWAIAVEHHETHIQIEDLYILQEFQNKGIGTAIILDIIEEAYQSHKPVRLRVLSSSPARVLYERLGFVVVQTTPQRYFLEYSD